MSQWYFSYDGQQMGPMDQGAAITQAAKNPNGHVWREGFSEWLPISRVAELSGSASSSGPAAPPPVSHQISDEIDFEIFGSEMQFVEVELDPGESAVAEAGAMMYKHPVINMETVFGDASQGKSGSGGGFMDKLVGAMALAAQDADAGFILSSARCSYEIVEKAVRAGATALVTISLPTSMAVERAKAAGLSLWCLARDDSVLCVNSPSD